MNLNSNDFRVTSDTHFFHKNALRFDKSPHRTIEDRNYDIIQKWNAVVTNDQYVFHLGDLAFSVGGDVKKKVGDILDQLNGKIVLVRGNHEESIEGLEDKFHDIVDYQEIFIFSDLNRRKGGQRICMSHYPMHDWNQCFRGSWMLHGHTHLADRDTYDKSLKRCNVGCMNWDYTPVSFQQLQIYMSDKTNTI